MCVKINLYDVSWSFINPDYKLLISTFTYFLLLSPLKCWFHLNQSQTLVLSGLVIPLRLFNPSYLLLTWEYSSLYGYICLLYLIHEKDVLAYNLIDGNRLSIAMDSENPQKLNPYAKCNHWYLGKFPGN